MSSTDNRIDELKINHERSTHSHKRKLCQLKQKKLKNHEHDSLTTNFLAGNDSNSDNLPPQTVGDDGHYYECVECNTEGILLCCDSCPNTYHLHCLSLPLESVPAGNWQCPKCTEDADLLAPLSALLMLKTHKNESEISVAPNGLKVYTRRRKGKSSAIHTEEDSRAMKIDINTTREETKELDLNTEGQESKFLFQQGNTSESAQTPEVTQVDKVSSMRDTMQALMNFLGFIQKNGRNETQKEKFARLRERQKQRISQNRSSPVVLGEKTAGFEPQVLNLSPLRIITGPSANSVYRLYGPPNSRRGLSILRDPRRLRWIEDILAGKKPVLPHAGNFTWPREMPNQTREGNDCLLAGLGSNAVPSTKSIGNFVVEFESSKAEEIVTFWQEEELDSLWVGVRKYGEGNWQDMMKDTSLWFSELKTVQDLAQRWNMEKEKLFNPGGSVLTWEPDNSVSTELRLNSWQPSQQQIPEERAEKQRLFVGGLIGISRADLESTMQ